MQFMVFEVGGDLSFRFSDCGSDWKIGTFKGGIKDTPQDVARSGLILDCLGRRKQTTLGPVWHISRDDLSALEVMQICNRVCAGTEPTSTFDLCAKVVRAMTWELSIKDVGRVQQIAEEVNRSFWVNSSKGEVR